jgi:hypothetical protein
MATRNTSSRKSTSRKSSGGRKSSSRKSSAKRSSGRKSAKKSSSSSLARSKVKKAMHERKEGTLKSGRSGKKVTSRKQAIAIGLSEARKRGAKVPKKRSQ